METRRNRWGQYEVLPPGGGKPVGYTRATTIAKALDDGGGLIPWKATATMVGALRRPGLMARWQALMAQQPDPWYGSPDSKKAAKALVEDCSEAGGSTDRADIGTALHAIIEQQLLGVAGTPILQPGMQADIDAFTAATAALSFDRTLIEAMVVLDEYKVAGTADMLSALVPGLGRIVVDNKTGAELKYSWQAIAMQLAIYAHADNVYVQGEAADGSQDLRLSMPEISQEVGLVIHLPAGEARCDLYEVDLVAGWEAFERAMWVRGYRTRKNLARPFTPIAQPAGHLPAPPVAEPPPFDEPHDCGHRCCEERDDPFHDHFLAPDVCVQCKRQQEGAALIAEAIAIGATVVAFPPDEPAASPVAEPPPFDEPEPLPPAATAPTPAEQHAALNPTPLEGGPADLDAFAALERHFAELPAVARAWVTALARSAQQHGVSFHAKENRTLRRFGILRGLLILALADAGGDDETVRAVLASVIGDVAWFPSIEAGHALGSLGAAEAEVFAQRCDQLATTIVPASVNDDGTVVLHFQGLAASPAA